MRCNMLMKQPRLGNCLHHSQHLYFDQILFNGSILDCDPPPTKLPFNASDNAVERGFTLIVAPAAISPTRSRYQFPINPGTRGLLVYRLVASPSPLPLPSSPSPGAYTIREATLPCRLLMGLERIFTDRTAVEIRNYRDDGQSSIAW
ncbi:hypothetical protein IF1G_01845 [Cordyceps javanica]|uniref:Uncharacterized protein n=1 Tax=Cordyceps javanica TaxID=43265 RepID=A0A545VD41_9HYPO|nr:hypothetical protein IF1G_01845 [Cordyceps javanica]